MVAGAVWTGTAALLAVSLGVALSRFTTGEAQHTGWLLLPVYAAAVTALQLLPSGEARRPVSRRRLILVCGLTMAGLASLAGTWYLGGKWPAFFTGGVTLLVLAVLTLFSDSSTAQPVPDRSRAAWLTGRVARSAVNILVIAVVFPLVGFSAAGAPLDRFRPGVPLALALPALAYHVAVHTGFFPKLEPLIQARLARMVTAGLTLTMLLGLIAVVGFFPGTPEIRILGVSPAIVAALLAPASLLHPSAAAGRRLAEILVKISFLMLIGSLALLYLVS